MGRVGVREIAIRDYNALDEKSWLRCRVLAFLHTAYFDDVVTTKPEYADAVELVALDDSGLVGLLDIAFDGPEATIETIAVDPDLTRLGIGSALLEEAKRRLPPGSRTLDAWTRDDQQVMDWYQAQGFVETFRYLHVYASSPAEAARAVAMPGPGLSPVGGFFHADIEAEQLLRDSFDRVHICRRYELTLTASVDGS